VATEHICKTTKRTACNGTHQQPWNQSTATAHEHADHGPDKAQNQRAFTHTAAEHSTAAGTAATTIKKTHGILPPGDFALLKISYVSHHSKKSCLYHEKYMNYLCIFYDNTIITTIYQNII
jgi:hypothetical protein